MNKNLRTGVDEVSKQNNKKSSRSVSKRAISNSCSALEKEEGREIDLLAALSLLCSARFVQYSTLQK